jgi:hypothetical protein
MSDSISRQSKTESDRPSPSSCESCRRPREAAALLSFPTSLSCALTTLEPAPSACHAGLPHSPCPPPRTLLWPLATGLGRAVQAPERRPALCSLASGLALSQADTEKFRKSQLEGLCLSASLVPVPDTARLRPIFGGALPGRLKVSLRAGRRNRDSACTPGAPCPRARTVAGFPRQFSPGDRERMGFGMTSTRAWDLRLPAHVSQGADRREARSCLSVSPGGRREARSCLSGNRRIAMILRDTAECVSSTSARHRPAACAPSLAGVRRTSSAHRTACRVRTCLRAWEGEAAACTTLV